MGLTTAWAAGEEKGSRSIQIYPITIPMIITIAPSFGDRK